MFRKFLTKNNLIIFLCLIIFSTLLAIFALSSRHPKSAPIQAFNVDQELSTLSKQNTGDLFKPIRDNLKELMKRGGIDGSIQLTDKAFVAGLIPLDECHSLMHLIGHAAYEYSNEDFHPIVSKDSNKCVASFQHGVEAQIVESKVNIMQAVPELKDYCAALRQVLPGITCYHGAGHGTMRITHVAAKSLQLCDALAGGPETDLSDCYRGVFSEYGNMALNYDGDTGEYIPTPSTVTYDSKHPLLTCQTYAAKYQDACYSQLTKIVYQGSDIEGTYKNCQDPKYTRSAQLTCTRIISGIYSEQTLYKNDFVAAPKIISTMSKDFRDVYVSGIKLGFLSYSTSGVRKDWQKSCNQLQVSDRQRCLAAYE
ncbi:MAG: hypothetical protein WDN47_00360 [Candidatus Doudnabacteria bacterium]